MTTGPYDDSDYLFIGRRDGSELVRLDPADTGMRELATRALAAERRAEAAEACCRQLYDAIAEVAEAGDIRDHDVQQHARSEALGDAMFATRKLLHSSGVVVVDVYRTAVQEGTLRRVAPGVYQTTGLGRDGDPKAERICSVDAPATEHPAVKRWQAVDSELRQRIVSAIRYSDNSPITGIAADAIEALAERSP